MFEALDHQKVLNESIMSRISVNEHDGASVIMASVYSRACYAFESAIILFERGLRADAVSSVRNLLELTFTIVSIAKDPHLHKRWAQQDLFFKKKTYDNHLRFSDYSQYSSKEELEALLEEVNESIIKVNAKQTGIVFWAEKAGMEKEYRIDYPQWCQSTHSGPRTVENDTLVQSEGKLTSFEYRPNFDGIDIPVARSLHYMRNILNSLSDRINIKCTDAELNLIGRIDSLLEENFGVLQEQSPKEVKDLSKNDDAPQTVSPPQTSIRETIISYATQNLRQEADKDYITARSNYYLRLHKQFQWSALHCLEKYFKAILLYQGVPVTDQGHDLIKLIKEITSLGIGIEKDDLTSSDRFINDLSKMGVDRYLIHQSRLLKSDLHELDQTVWKTRRFCQLNINFNENKELNQQPQGYLERVLESSDHFKRQKAALLFNNPTFGGEENGDWFQGSENPRLSDGNISDEEKAILKKFIIIPKKK